MAQEPFDELLQAVESGDLAVLDTTLERLGRFEYSDNPDRSAKHTNAHWAIRTAIEADRVDMLDSLLAHTDGIELSSVLQRAGCSDRYPLRPEMIEHLIDSEYFADFVRDAGSRYYPHDLASRPEDVSGLLEKMLEKANDTAGDDPQRQASLQGKNNHALDGAAHHGHANNLATLIPHADEEALAENLVSLAKSGWNQLDKDARTMPQKVAMLLDSVTDPEAHKKALLGASERGLSTVVEVLFERMEDQALRNKALLTAASHLEGDSRVKDMATPNVKTMLREAQWSDETLLAALEKSIDVGRVETMSDLAAAARAQDSGERRIINTPTSDDSTLLIHAAKYPGPKKALAMASLLAKEGASPKMDSHGENPIDILTERKHGEHQVVRHLESMLGNRTEGRAGRHSGNGAAPRDGERPPRNNGGTSGCRPGGGHLSHRAGRHAPAQATGGRIFGCASQTVGRIKRSPGTRQTPEIIRPVFLPRNSH